MKNIKKVYWQPNISINGNVYCPYCEQWTGKNIYIDKPPYKCQWCGKKVVLESISIVW